MYNNRSTIYSDHLTTWDADDQQHNLLSTSEVDKATYPGRADTANWKKS